MGIWIEFRCEGRCDEGATVSSVSENARFRCWSSDNDGPMGMAADTIVDVAATVSSLAEDARKCGWKRLKDGWTCPACIFRRSHITEAPHG